jgi:hypothetical protein
MALGPTHFPIRWVPGALSLGGKAAGAWSWPLKCRGQRMSGAILPLPSAPSWRGAQLKESTGTTLPLPFTFYLYKPFRVTKEYSLHLLVGICRYIRICISVWLLLFDVRNVTVFSNAEANVAPFWKLCSVGVTSWNFRVLLLNYSADVTEMYEWKLEHSCTCVCSSKLLQSSRRMLMFQQLL